LESGKLQYQADIAFFLSQSPRNLPKLEWITEESTCDTYIEKAEKKDRLKMTGLSLLLN